jgi:hypothetical protein
MASSGLGFASRKQRKPEPERVNQAQKPIHHAMRVQKPNNGPGNRYYLIDRMTNRPLGIVVNVHPNSEHKDYALNAKQLNARIHHLVGTVLHDHSNGPLQVRKWTGQRNHEYGGFIITLSP